MNILATAEIAITSEDLASPLVMEAISSPRGLSDDTPGLSAEQEAFLGDHYSTKLEDPQTGRWIRSWRTGG